MTEANKEMSEMETHENDNNEVAEDTKSGRRVVLVVNGEEVSRVDYIRNRWIAGATRGTIAKELTELQGKHVSYQIVFAATKGIENAPATVNVANDDE